MYLVRITVVEGGKEGDKFYIYRFQDTDYFISSRPKYFHHKEIPAILEWIRKKYSVSKIELITTLGEDVGV